MTARELAIHMKAIAEQICDGKLFNKTGRRPQEVNLTACLAVLTIEKQILAQLSKGETLEFLEFTLRFDYPTYFAQVDAPTVKRSAFRQLLLDLGFQKSA
jgi:hypothetical protein